MGFVNERNDARATTAEQNCADRHPGKVFPLICDGGALRCRHGEASIWVRRGCFRCRCPVFAAPIDEVGRRFSRHALPPHIALVSFGNVGKNAVLRQRLDGVGIGVETRAGRDAEKASFGVDGVELTVITELHPANIVTDRLDRPTGNGGH